MAETVTAPDGRRWVVRRRWLPRLGGETLWGRFSRRLRQTFRRAGDAADADPGCLEVLGEGFVAAIVIIVVVLALVFVFIPLLVAIVDLLFLLALALLGALARILFRRPWIVEARADDATTLRWRVTGWRASHERCVQVAQQLQAGTDPDPGIVR
ncbi:MAG TPA: hypothetical protein VFS16_05720 [Acidimicrobiia bacterium]|nr:hypothetical protein [Acidimicrobiia bacterium]